MNRTALYPGSFTIFTLGHLFVIESGARLFDRLIVMIATNSEKKNSFMSPEVRAELICACTSHLPNVEVVIVPDEFTVMYAEQRSAKYILRGLRDSTDFEYEHGMCDINRDIDTEIETVFLMPPTALSRISSSMIEGMMKLKHWEKVVVTKVPKPVFDKLVEMKQAMGAAHAKSS